MTTLLASPRLQNYEFVPKYLFATGLLVAGRKGLSLLQSYVIRWCFWCFYTTRNILSIFSIDFIWGNFSRYTTLQTKLPLKKWVSRSFSPNIDLKLWFYWFWRAFEAVAPQETRPLNLEMSLYEEIFRTLQLCKRNYHCKKWPRQPFPAQTMIFTDEPARVSHGRRFSVEVFRFSLSDFYSRQSTSVAFDMKTFY